MLAGVAVTAAEPAWRGFERANSADRKAAQFRVRDLVRRATLRRLESENEAQVRAAFPSSIAQSRQVSIQHWSPLSRALPFC
jgi:hypothetical protein